MGSLEEGMLQRLSHLTVSSLDRQLVRKNPESIVTEQCELMSQALKRAFLDWPRVALL